jgi:hypothetical protein
MCTHEYAVAAAESLMVDYCDYILSETPTLRVVNDDEEEYCDATTTIEFFEALNQNEDQLLTPKQCDLKIPIPLVVAAVFADQIVDCRVVVRLSDDNVEQRSIHKRKEQKRNEVFRRLQMIWVGKGYSQRNTSRIQQRHRQQRRYYEWSPTLLLQSTNDNDMRNVSLQKQFDSILHRRRTRLENMAENATTQLLSEINKDLSHENKKERKERRVQKVTVASISGIDSDDDDDEGQTDRSEHLNVESSRFQPNYDDQYDDGAMQLPQEEWTQVRSRRKVEAALTPIEPHFRQELDTIDLNISTHTASERKRNSTYRVEHSSGSSCVVETEPNSSTPTIFPVKELLSDGAEATASEVIIISNKIYPGDNGKDPPLACSNGDPDDQTSCSTLLDQIKLLELQLETKERQILEERVSAQKQLQTVKDQSLERIQALQLRLYISETRLQTYEDALQQHVESVAQNTALTASPGRYKTSAPVSETPPLYARALQPPKA